MQRPNEIENRVQVDGWCTRLFGLHSFAHCECDARALRREGQSGKAQLCNRGGEMQLRFSARSETTPLKTFAWGAILDFDNPKNAKPIEFIADDKAHEYAIDFPVDQATSRRKAREGVAL